MMQIVNGRPTSDLSRSSWVHAIAKKAQSLIEAVNEKEAGCRISRPTPGADLRMDRGATTTLLLTLVSFPRMLVSGDKYWTRHTQWGHKRARHVSDAVSDCVKRLQAEYGLRA